MKKIRKKSICVLITIFCFLYTTISFSAAKTLVPLTPQCIKKASKIYGVPLSVLFAVLATERGKVGEVNHNKNGTIDVGPMQINTVHFDDARKYGLTPEILTNNGCANFFFGTWYLATLLEKHDVWEAIGIYHSKTPYYKKRYQNRAWTRFKELNIRELLLEINAPLLKKRNGKISRNESASVYDPVSETIQIQ